MAVVGALQLVFDEDELARVGLLAEDVRSERPYVLLLRFDCKARAPNFAKAGDGLLLRKPRVKAASPYFAYRPVFP